MKNKVESLKGYNLIEANEDVVKLFNGLKELTFKTHEVQYGYWTVCQTVRKVLTMRQQDNKPLAEYYKRFTLCVDVTESQGMPDSEESPQNEIAGQQAIS
jgi:DNA-directed RNA polymerase alpha subunit